MTKSHFPSILLFIFYLTGHIGLGSYVDFFADPYQQLIYLCLFIYAYPLINT